MVASELDLKITKTSNRKKILFLFSTLTFIYVLLGALLFIFQRNFLYFPSNKYNHPYPTQTFHQNNESIEVIVLNKGQEKSIIFFGGNGEAVVNSASDHIRDFPTHTLYLVNYRGYGGSSGFPAEQTIYSDALHIYDEIKNKYSSISVIGRSLGTGVATYVASKRTVEKMVLITPYDSVESIAQSQYPIFPITLLLKDKFNSVARVDKIKAETLIVIAEHDEVIPLKNSMRLFNAFPASLITMETIKNTGHNSISRSKEFHFLLRDFIEKSKKRP